MKCRCVKCHNVFENKVGWWWRFLPHKPSPLKCPCCGGTELETSGEMTCPKCGVELEYFSGLESLPEYLYCPACQDYAYDPSTGEIIGRIE